MLSLLSARKEVLAELFKRGEFSPLVTKDDEVNQKQWEALKALTNGLIRELAYGGAAGGGKSWIGCTWLLFMCFLYPGIKAFIGREELKRLKDSTLLTFFKVAKEYGFKYKEDWFYHAQEHYIYFANGSRIDLLDLAYVPRDPMYERYGSLEYTIGWLEEAGEIHFGAYDTLKSRVGRQFNDKYNIIPVVLTTLNPKKNWCHGYFWKPFKDKTMPADRMFLQALSHENHFQDSGYQAQLEGIKDKVRRQRLLLGNFDYDDDEASLILYDAIGDCFTNSHVLPGRRCITVDLARQGGDKIVMIAWDGFRGTVTYWDKKDLDKSSERIEAKRLALGLGKSDVLVDQDGMGGGVVDFMKYKGFVNNSRPLPAPINPKRDEKTGAPVPENYDNLKSQCSYRMADIINNKQLYLICDADIRDTITEEMEQVKKKEIDTDKKNAIMSKADVKDAIGHSPDFWDSIMMRIYFELHAQKIAVVA